MQIAYLISAHTDPEQLGRMLRALEQKDTAFFIHIDKRADIAPFIAATKGIGGVNFTSQRIATHWGAYSQVLYQKILLEECLDSKMEFQRICLLTGQDFPLISNQRINKILETNPECQFIIGYNVTSGSDNYAFKKTLSHYYPLRDSRFPLKKISFLLLKWLGVRRKPYIMVDGQRWDIYKSSAYMFITQQLAEFIVAQLNTNRALTNYFRLAYTPDELCLPTIIFNSPFRHQAELRQGEWKSLSDCSAITYFNYSPVIQVFDESNLDELLSSGKMFARKFSSTKSLQLMKELRKKFAAEDNE